MDFANLRNAQSASMNPKQYSDDLSAELCERSDVYNDLSLNGNPSSKLTFLSSKASGNTEPRIHIRTWPISPFQRRLY